jgi:hypothetical protein
VTAHSIDVALTYACEQGVYVGGVNEELRRSGVITFYSPLEEDSLWGEDLIPYLDRVFREWATLCVMFISKEYVAKAWPSLERQSALARQMLEHSVYILPVRFDESPVPGLSPTIAYLRATDHTCKQLAEKVCHKLKIARTSPAPAPSTALETH